MKLILAVLMLSSTAMAQVTVDYGLSAGFMLVTKTTENPIAVAPKAGYQLSISEQHLNLTFMGKSYDMLSLQLIAMGTMLPGSTSKEFGALALAGGLCSLNGAICAGAFKNVIDTNNGLISGREGWAFMFALTLNFGLATPPSPDIYGAPVPARGATFYLF